MFKIKCMKCGKESELKYLYDKAWDKEVLTCTGDVRLKNNEWTLDIVCDCGNKINNDYVFEG